MKNTFISHSQNTSHLNMWGFPPTWGSLTPAGCLQFSSFLIPSTWSQCGCYKIGGIYIRLSPTWRMPISGFMLYFWPVGYKLVFLWTPSLLSLKNFSKWLTEHGKPLLTFNGLLYNKGYSNLMRWEPEGDAQGAGVEGSWRQELPSCGGCAPPSQHRDVYWVFMEG